MELCADSDGSHYHAIISSFKKGKFLLNNHQKVRSCLSVSVNFE